MIGVLQRSWRKLSSERRERLAFLGAGIFGAVVFGNSGLDLWRKWREATAMQPTIINPIQTFHPDDQTNEPLGDLGLFVADGRIVSLVIKRSTYACKPEIGGEWKNLVSGNGFPLDGSIEFQAGTTYTFTYKPGTPEQQSTSAIFTLLFPPDRSKTPYYTCRFDIASTR